MNEFGAAARARALRVQLRSDGDELKSELCGILGEGTHATRRVAKLKAIKAELQPRKHHRTSEVGAWLRNVVRGYCQYHAVPGNTGQLRVFRRRVCRLWRSVLVLRPLDYVTKCVSGLLACELPLDGNPVAIHTTIPGPSLLAQASDVSDSAFA